MNKHFLKKDGDNNFIYEREDLYRKHLESLPVGKRLELTMKVFKPLRSGQQNKYYWAVVIDYFCQEMGELPDDVHSMLTDQFLREPVEGHEELYIVKSTTTLDTEEFWAYIEMCRVLYFNMFNGVIPDPYVTGYKEYER